MNGFFPANEHNPAGPFPSFPPPSDSLTNIVPLA